jgi:hypothetical protein
MAMELWFVFFCMLLGCHSLRSKRLLTPYSAAAQDIAVGARGDDDPTRDIPGTTTGIHNGTIYPENRGAVYILFLNTNGTVKAHQKISDAHGNFQGRLANNDYFGSSLAGLRFGDFTAIAVGAINTDGGRENAVYVLFLHPNGTVNTDHKILDTDSYDLFGSAVADLGDLDGDAVTVGRVVSTIRFGHSFFVR